MSGPCEMSCGQITSDPTALTALLDGAGGLTQKQLLSTDAAALEDGTHAFYSHVTDEETEA